MVQKVSSNDSRDGYYTDFAAEFTGPRDPARVRELTPEVLSLREWLKSAKAEG